MDALADARDVSAAEEEADLVVVEAGISISITSITLVWSLGVLKTYP